MARFNRSDSFNLLSKITPRRAWNGMKVLSSYYISKWTKRPVQWGYPVSISFEPTTSCNLRCPECPSGLRAFTRPTGMLQKDFFSETIDQLSQRFIVPCFLFPGRTVSESRFFGYGRICFEEKNLYRHFHQCTLLNMMPMQNELLKAD